MNSLITNEKIEEWIREVQQRPDSAALILQQIAARLAELSQTNERLRSQNIDLMSGAKVESYEQRITHLEYQIELLKRRFHGELPDLNLAPSESIKEPSDNLTLLVYDPQAYVVRFEIGPNNLVDGHNLGQLAGSPFVDGSPPRLEIVPTSEELMFTFTSGRIATLPVHDIAAVTEVSNGIKFDWAQAAQPVEPSSGEELAFIAPITRLALADYYIQTSRKGYIKKIRAAMGETILGNRYLGTGVKSSPDQSFNLTLCNLDDRMAFVSFEGYLQCLQVEDLPPILEQSMRLEIRDYLMSAFVIKPEKPVVVMTQLGKAIHWTEDRLETSRSHRSKGQSLFTASRRSQGVRVLDAASVDEASWGAAVHSDGSITLHSIESILRSGKIDVRDQLLAFRFYNDLLIDQSPVAKSPIDNTQG